MQKFNRAERRIQIARLRAKRSIYWYGDRREHTPRTLGKVLNTPQACSCRACGNQRKFEGPTLQERRHRIALAEHVNGFHDDQVE